jgi:hypothetical protein
MEDVVDFVKGFDLHTIIIVAIIIVAIAFWWMNGNINEKLERLSFRIDRIETRLSDVEMRLSRIEGAFSVRNVCLLEEGK